MNRGACRATVHGVKKETQLSNQTTNRLNLALLQITLILPSLSKVEEKGYHISVGMEYSKNNVDTESSLRLAEKKMYDEKAKYYQNKETKAITKLANRSMEAGYTGINEIDACLSAMSIKYLGVFCLSHNNDDAKLILSPSYFSESQLLQTDYLLVIISGTSV